MSETTQATPAPAPAPLLRYRRGDNVRPEHAHIMHGVPGRMLNAIAAGDPGLFANQTFIAQREVGHGDTRELVKISIRWDDECNNGHNSFSVTGDVYIWDTRRVCAGWRLSSCGQVRTALAHAFPELTHLLAWHLCSSDGPMHYEANTIYHAGDRDFHGLRLGESRQIRHGGDGKLGWKLEPIKAPQYVDGPTCPARCRIGEGKVRELALARSSAVWPDATDAELEQEPDALRAALRARLPRLLLRLRAAVEGAGFLWETPQ